MTIFKPHGIPEKARPLIAIAGALLILGGFQQFWTGWHNRPPAIQPSATLEIKPSSDLGNETTLYRLTLDRDAEAWIVTPTSGNKRWQLPAVLPAPPAWQPPARPMSLADWSDFFSRQIETGALQLAPSAWEALAGVTIAGVQPFAEMETKAQIADKPSTKPAGTMDGIPGELDPRSPIFARQMRAWRDRVREGLRRAPVIPAGYRFQSTHPHIHGRRQLVMSSIARARVLAGDFSKKRQDILIYLQVLCNFHGVSMKIDGVTGPQTRKNVDAMAYLVFSSDTTRQAYINQLRPWIGR